MSIDLADLPEKNGYVVAAGGSNSEIRDPLSIELNGSALLLTDATWSLQITTSPGAAPAIDESTTSEYTSSGVYVDDAANGQITLIVTETDIATLAAEASTWHYSVHLKLPTDHPNLPDWDGHIRAGTIYISDVA